MPIIEEGIIRGGELIPTKEIGESHRRAFGQCVRCFVLFAKAKNSTQRIRIVKLMHHLKPMLLMTEDDFSRAYEVASHFIKGRPYHEFLPK